MIEYTELVAMKKLNWANPKVFVSINKDKTVIKISMQDFIVALQVELASSVKWFVGETQQTKIGRTILMWAVSKILGVGLRKPIVKILNYAMEPAIKEIMKELQEAPQIAVKERG